MPTGVVTRDVLQQYRWKVSKFRVEGWNRRRHAVAKKQRCSTLYRKFTFWYHIAVLRQT